MSDDRLGVGEERPQVVDAATYAKAIHAAVGAVAATGPVVGDRRSADEHRATRDIDATAETGAAVGTILTIASQSRVVSECAVDDGEDIGTGNATACTQAGAAAAAIGS